ncbi:MAG: DNA polymerase III [Treponema sp.]|nr:DNA polymerase III [Treponema sp.]
MLENLVGQDAAKAIVKDIKNNNFPGAVLFAGSSCTGKLTAALEVARALSCNGDDKPHWLCECPSCLRHKALNCANILLMGPRDCSLEISAAKDSFIKSYRDNDSHLKACRYLFLRSVRKLTLRFSGILWEGESNLNKLAPVMEKINENLELIDFPRELPPFDETVKICGELEADSLKLESDFLYDSIPVNQIRNMEKWACIRADEGKKTVIIENAESMQVSVRNALLKILEEPPEDCVFILLTTRRNAIMETILSRVRTYNFKDRPLEVQQDVIKRVFHNEYFNGQIDEFLLNYLPYPADKVRVQSKEFFQGIMNGKIPDCDALVKTCANFEPRVEFKIFLNGITEHVRPALASMAGTQACAELSKTLRQCYENVTLYNQGVKPALECLIRDINKINVLYGRVFSAI